MDNDGLEDESLGAQAAREASQQKSQGGVQDINRRKMAEPMHADNMGLKEKSGDTQRDDKVSEQVPKAESREARRGVWAPPDTTVIT